MSILKRHPVLTLLAALLLVIACTDRTTWSLRGSPPHESYFGCNRGHIQWGSYTHPQDAQQVRYFYPWPDAVHLPRLGREFKFSDHPNVPGLFEALIPIWPLLLAIVGSVVFRERQRRNQPNPRTP